MWLSCVLVVGDVHGFGLVVGDEKERKTQRRRTEMKREEKRERDFFYIILFCNIYYFNIL